MACYMLLPLVCEVIECYFSDTQDVGPISALAMFPTPAGISPAQKSLC